MPHAGDYTLKEASKVLEVSIRTLGEWCRSGKWKGVAYKLADDTRGQWWVPYQVVQNEKNGVVEATVELPSYLPSYIETIQLVAASQEEVTQEVRVLQGKLDAQEELLRELLRRLPEPEAKRAGIVARVKAMLKR